MSDLSQKKCIPCETHIPPLSKEQVDELLAQISGWDTIMEDTVLKIDKKLSFENFIEAMKFVNQVAEIAESEGHHPDIHIHYNEVDIRLWTHSIGGLHENDFIVAAKIDSI